jgi:hypothetical protein
LRRERHSSRAAAAAAAAATTTTTSESRQHYRVPPKQQQMVRSLVMDPSILDKTARVRRIFPTDNNNCNEPSNYSEAASPGHNHNTNNKIDEECKQRKRTNNIFIRWGRRIFYELRLFRFQWHYHKIIVLIFTLIVFRIATKYFRHHRTQQRLRSLLSRTRGYRFPSPRNAPLVNDDTGLPNVVYGCADTRRTVEEIQIHVLGWQRVSSLMELLQQLQNAKYENWGMDIPLYIHLDGKASGKVVEIAKSFHWTHGPKRLDIRTENKGLREMWFTSMSTAAQIAGDDTLLLCFEDDMRVSSFYFQYLLSVIDAYGRNRDCRDANLMGYSLSPIKIEEMRKPFTRWRAYQQVGDDLAYLTVLPSSWGVAYWSDRWNDFSEFLKFRLKPEFYFTEAEDNMQPGQPYDELNLTPREFYIPDSRSNVWPKSWKRFMVDFMYAQGLLMLYPNLPNEQGLATTLALSGEHTTIEGSRNNPRVAELLDREFSELGSLPRYGDLHVLGLHLEPTTKERLAADGATFLDNAMKNCNDCDALIRAWARPGWFGTFTLDHSPLICAPDLYMPASALYLSNEQATRYLLFEPQYGANNQLFAIVGAYFWAQALNRQLVLPPIFLPRVSAFNNTNVSPELWQVSDTELVFDVQYVKEDDQMGSTLLKPLGFRKWLQQNATISRILRISRDAVFDTPTRILSAALKERSPQKHQNIYFLNLRHLFEEAYSISDIQHLLGGCGDEVLAFDGMFFAKMTGYDPRSLMPDVLSFSEEAEKIYRSVQSKLHEEFGSSKNYACYHVRLGDFLTMCDSINNAGTDSEIHKKVPSTIETAQKFACAVTPEDLRSVVESVGLPALVMSDNPNILNKILPTLPVRTLTSDWVNRAVEQFLPSNTSENDHQLFSLVVEEQLCAESSIAFLNRFSTVSLRIKILRNGRRFVFWRRNLWETQFYGLLQATKVRGGMFN